MSSKHPIPPTTLPSTSTISPLATTSGTHPLTIGQNTYIQVRAHLSTDHGPVTIGSGCVIGEYSTVGLQQQDSEKDDETIDDDVGAGPGEGVVIEDHVVIEAKAVIEGGTRIGEGTMVECGAKIGKGARVGKIAPLCSVPPGEVVPDYTVIYGFNERRIDRSVPEAVRVRTAEALVEVLKKAEMAMRATQSARKAGN
ncbi:MAG: hypothetical protein LQ352_001124 [Teloschistes flavicans]|nr:MAG: hypothetical protein LQ352_001124 [Teloschistes flavicans]